MFNTFFQDRYLLDYNQDEVLLDSYINIDSNQVFPKLNISYIDRSICKSNNPKTGLFLGENPHLINADYLNENENIINNPNFFSKNKINFDENCKKFENFVKNKKKKTYNNYNNYIDNNLEFFIRINFSFHKNNLAKEFVKNNPQIFE